MFSNLSSSVQASGAAASLGSWFKKDVEQKEGEEGEAKAEGSTSPKEATSPLEKTEAPKKGRRPKREKKMKKEGDDETGSNHSGATESADSNPPSDAEEEGAEGKAGFAQGLMQGLPSLKGLPNMQGLNVEAPEMPESFGVNMAALKGRASSAGTNMGGFFSSAFSKASAATKDASNKIRETVEKNPGATMLAEFNKEQEAFIAAKGGKPGEAVAPWVGYPEEEALKEEIIALSTDRRNFVRAPPTGVSFEFELEAFLPIAQATLEADPNLEKMRFELVPKVINEENFWKNYFYRVGLIRQSTELNSLEKESSETPSQTANEEDKGLSKGSGKDEEVEHPDSPSHGESEFVSDSFQPSSKDLEEIKKGISNLTKPSSG